MADLHHNQSLGKSMTDEEYEEQLVNLYKTKVEKAREIERQNWFNKLSKKEQYNLFLSKLPKILTQIEVQNDAEQITPIFRASQAKLLEFQNMQAEKPNSFALSERQQRKIFFDGKREFKNT